MSNLQIEYVSPDSLNPAPYNPREIAEDSLKRLAKLLDSHGFVDPLIARREDNLLLGGHQRLKANALREKPDAKVPVVFLEGLDDAKAKALNISLNNPHAMGSWDLRKLTDLLVEIDTGEFEVPEFTAFSTDDIAELVHGGDEFQPSDEEPPRLDEKTPVTCPECGHVFTT